MGPVFFCNDLLHWISIGLVQISFLFQHDYEMFRFIAEVEYAHAPAIEDAGEGNGAMTGAPDEVGEIAVERAYAEAKFDKAFNLKLGKDLTPTLWQLNHYPNLVMPYTEPQMVKNVFKGRNIGLLAHGKLGGGLRYHAWTGNSEASYTQGAGGQITIVDDKQPLSLGGKITWESNFSNGSVAVAALAARYNDATSGSTSPLGLEMNLTFERFLVWAEYASTKKGDPALDGKVSGFYTVVSYAFDVGSQGQLSPFFMVDTFKDTSSAVDAQASNRYALGLNYKPVATAAAKLEYLRTLAANGNAESTGLSMSLAYFFN